MNIMDENTRIVVGTGIGGQKNIVDALRKNGFEVEPVRQMWPRDHYVHFQDEYVVSGSPGFVDGNAYGEGGNILTGNDFLLVTDMVYLHEPMSDRLPRDPSHEQILDVIIQEGRVHYPSARIHIAPSGYFHGGKGHSHIDMFSLLLPKQRILLLDTHYGKGAGGAEEYDAIAEAEGLKLIRYDGSQDGVWYPLNSLVLSSDHGDIAVVDDKAVSLVRLLQSEGVQTISVEMPQHAYPAGKIRCQTNTYNPRDSSDDLMGKI